MIYETLVWVHISESVLSKCEEAIFILRKTTTIKQKKKQLEIPDSM